MRNNRGSLILLALGVFLTVKVGLNVAKLYKAGERVVKEEKKLAEAQTENRELKERLAEVQTPEFMEREAREKLGMGREGEVVVIIPEEELKGGSDKPQATDQVEANWVKWRKLYLGW
jgi:cell division protein FtsB